MERTLWTDERMDDALTRIERHFERIDRNFERVDRNFERVWDELREVRSEISASNRQLTQIGWALVGVLLAQLMAAVIAGSVVAFG